MKMQQICYECGESVKGGSGKFVNRVPSGDDYEDNKIAGRPYPKGEWLCGECDERIFDDNNGDCLHNFNDGICKICGYKEANIKS